ncbi:acetyl xylan esterase [Lysobacteraceae bacterium NML08-0793]|nr:acetyl xylan esterase [Xanthomonadaceae bacterium NML08-0793]
MKNAALHRPPRYPQMWLFWCVLVHALVAGLFWLGGMWVGLVALLAGHLFLLWGVLWPYSSLYGPVLTHLLGDAPRVWLTIDDGPSHDTRALLDVLDAHRARATFFLVAERARQHPELVQEIIRRGHQIGNHSLSHPAAWFWALGPWRMHDEIHQAQQILGEIAGQPPRWFRAVVGMANPFVHAPLKALGLARVAWSARGFDGVSRSVEEVLATLEKDLRPGAIVLLHEGGDGRHVEILRRVLQRLDALGLRAELPD